MDSKISRPVIMGFYLLHLAYRHRCLGRPRRPNLHRYPVYGSLSPSRSCTLFECV